MKRRSQVAIYSGASALWAMAVLGAIGVAHWLEMSSQDAILLVVAVALIAIIGSFIPAVQLGMDRSRQARQERASDRERREPPQSSER